MPPIYPAGTKMEKLIKLLTKRCYLLELPVVFPCKSGSTDEQIFAKYKEKVSLNDHKHIPGAWDYQNESLSSSERIKTRTITFLFPIFLSAQITSCNKRQISSLFAPSLPICFVQNVFIDQNGCGINKKNLANQNIFGTYVDRSKHCPSNCLSPSEAEKRHRIYAIL